MQNYKSNSFHSPIQAIKCGNLKVDFSTPLVMGILNITPDSFFDGGKYITRQAIVDRAGKMLEEGASILDLGAYSTRPGAADVTTEEELERMMPAVEVIRKEFPDAMLSIDTFRAEVAKQVVKNYGACFINDISGGTMDEKMFETVGELQVPYIMMHIQGTPQNMQQNPFYEDLMSDILAFFTKRLEVLKANGVQHVILDPGFGFGKTLEHNYEILAKLPEFHALNLPLLVGVSRKSMIYKLLGGQPDHSLNGTTVLNTAALLNGAHILRVHDVREAVEVVKIVEMMKNQML